MFFFINKSLRITIIWNKNEKHLTRLLQNINERTQNKNSKYKKLKKTKTLKKEEQNFVMHFVKMH